MCITVCSPGSPIDDIDTFCCRLSTRGWFGQQTEHSQRHTQGCGPVVYGITRRDNSVLLHLGGQCSAGSFITYGDTCIALRNNDSIRQGITGHEDYSIRMYFYVNVSPNQSGCTIRKSVYEVKEETWSSTTFLILASSSGVTFPVDISSRRGDCELVKCDLNSASHWVILSTGMVSSYKTDKH